MIGSLFKSVGDVFSRGVRPPAFEVPAELPGLKVRSGVALAAQAGVSTPPAAAATGTVSQLFNYKLNAEQDMLGAVQLLAHALPEKSALRWATDSAAMVERKLPPAQREALSVAQAFQARPTSATREAAAAAAAKAGMHGPGGLAAKAASFATIPGEPAVPGAETLLPTCVAGAIVTAVALSPPKAPPLPELPPVPKTELAGVELPNQPLAPVLPEPGGAAAARNAAAFKPFIDRGLALAAGG